MYASIGPSPGGFTGKKLALLDDDQHNAYKFFWAVGRGDGVDLGGNTKLGQRRASITSEGQNMK